jgi:hypothetical protein
MRKIIFAFIVLSVCLETQATSLVNRYQFLSTDVLPDEIWTFGVSHGQSVGMGRDSFSSTGEKISNQQFFSKDVTYSNLIDEIKVPIERDLAQAAFSVYGRNDSTVAGRVINDVDVSQSSNTYVLGRGLGKKASLFLVFPIVTIKTKFISRFEQSTSLSKLGEELRSEGQFRQAQEIVEKSENALSKRLDENGYDNTYPTELTTLANVHINYRYQVINLERFKLSSDSILVVPAGKKFNQNEFLYLKINEEQYSYKQSVTGQFAPSADLSLLSSAYYHKRFSFTQSRRIPKNSTSPLSSDIDPATQIKFGDTFGASTQLNYSSNDSLVFYLGQSFEVKQKDSTAGSAFATNRYDYLEKDTAQKLGITYIGVALNTIQYFLTQKFPAPVDLNVQYSVTNYGKNTLDNQALAMNLMVFYK